MIYIIIALRNLFIYTTLRVNHEKLKLIILGHKKCLLESNLFLFLTVIFFCFLKVSET